MSESRRRNDQADCHLCAVMYCDSPFPCSHDHKAMRSEQFVSNLAKPSDWLLTKAVYVLIAPMCLPRVLLR